MTTMTQTEYTMYADFQDFEKSMKIAEQFDELDREPPQEFLDLLARIFPESIRRSVARMPWQRDTRAARLAVDGSGLAHCPLGALFYTMWAQGCGTSDYDHCTTDYLPAVLQTAKSRGITLTSEEQLLLDVGLRRFIWQIADSDMLGKPQAIAQWLGVPSTDDELEVQVIVVEQSQAVAVCR